MKNSKLLQIAALVAVAGTLSFSKADAALSLTMAKNGVGWSDPSASPPAQADMLGYLTTMINLYNNHADGYSQTITISGANDGSGTSLDQFDATVDKGTAVPVKLDQVFSLSGNQAVPAGASGSGPSTYTINLGNGGFSYLIAGWDGKNGADQVYYVGGLSGKVSISNNELASDFRKGLSNFWLSGTGNSPVPNNLTVVPEPSTIIAGMLLLLPLGASAFRILRRRAQV